MAALRIVSCRFACYLMAMTCDAQAYRSRVEGLFLDLLACADREETLGLFLRQFPGIPDAIGDAQIRNEKPEECATRLVAVCVSQALCDGSVDDRDKRLALLQIRELADHGSVLTGQPHRLTGIAFNIADMTDRWYKEGLVDRGSVEMAVQEVMRAMRGMTKLERDGARAADILAAVPVGSAAVH